jgi:hypothetical protein
MSEIPINLPSINPLTRVSVNKINDYAKKLSHPDELFRLHKSQMVSIFEIYLKSEYGIEVDSFYIPYFITCKHFKLKNIPKKVRKNLQIYGFLANSTFYLLGVINSKFKKAQRKLIGTLINLQIENKVV